MCLLCMANMHIVPTTFSSERPPYIGFTCKVGSAPTFSSPGGRHPHGLRGHPQLSQRPAKIGSSSISRARPTRGHGAKTAKSTICVGRVPTSAGRSQIDTTGPSSQRRTLCTFIYFNWRSRISRTQGRKRSTCLRNAEDIDDIYFGTSRTCRTFFVALGYNAPKKKPQTATAAKMIDEAGGGLARWYPKKDGVN